MDPVCTQCTDWVTISPLLWGFSAMGAVSAGVETVSVCLLFVYFVRKDGLIGRSMLASVSGGT